MKYLLTFAAALLTAGKAHAALACVPGTYDTYTAIGFECEINGALFNNFSFPATSNGGDLSESDITVTPLSGANFVGLRFSANFSSTGTVNGPGNFQGQVVEQYRFFYDVSLAGGLFTDITASVNGGSVFSPNAQKPSGYLAGLVIANDAAGAFVQDDTVGQADTTPLNTARSNISIDMFAQLTGGASVDSDPPFGVGEYDSFDNVFLYELEVPEPQTAALMLLALAAGSVLRRRLAR